MLWREHRTGNLLQAFPSTDELVFPAGIREELIELALEDIGIGKRKSAVVEGGEYP